MFGVHKQDVRSLNTMLKVSQEQKGSDIENLDTQRLRIVRVALAVKGEIIYGA